MDTLSMLNFVNSSCQTCKTHEYETLILQYFNPKYLIL